MLRRRHLFAVAAPGAFGLALPAIARGADADVLRVIPSANLTSLDPIWTTAPATKDHAYLIYDQITAVDANSVPRPQMAQGWEVTEDRLAWTFTLRNGLRFHDGEPVRSADCIASIRRWWVRDGFGQALARACEEIAELDDHRFRFRLKRPFPLLAAALGKSSSSQCFIMPQRVAETNPFHQITDPIGSGPFRFIREEWIAGARSAYARHNAYVPRSEPVSGIAGGRAPRVARVEWAVMPDAPTAAAALRAGEQDVWQQPLHDLLPALRRDRNIVVEPRDLSGTYGMLRFNHLHPPFDDPAMRRAVAMGVDQTAYMHAIAGAEPRGWGTCASYYTCGTPLGTEVGGDLVMARNIEAARTAVGAAGNRARKVVALTATDSAANKAMGEVTTDLLRRLGFDVDHVATDWGTLLQRRSSQEPLDRGGWSVFHTVWTGADILNPAVNTMLQANGRRAWFGWPTDPELETLRAAWFDAPDEAASQRAAQAVQEQAFRSIPYVPLGYFIQPAAWRRNLTGMFPAPTSAYWNVGKER